MIHLPEKKVRRELICWVAVVGSVAILALFSHKAFAQEQAPKAPTSRQDNVREVIHGTELVDPYRWLEDQDSSETRQWIDAQNKYSHSLLDGLPARPFIQKRLTELMRIDTVSVPFEQGGRYFLFKKRAEDDLPILYVRKGLNSNDEVLLDPHTLSPDHTTSIDLEDTSGDGKLIAYGIRRGGEDETELRVMDVDSRKDLSDRLPRALYRGASFKKDGSGFYYNLQKRDVGMRIFYHAIGTDPAKDVEVFGKGYGPDKWVGATVSEDGRYLLFGVQHGWARNEVYVQKVSGGPIKTIVKGVGAHFYASFAGDRLVIQTDWQAPNGRIMVVDLKDSSRDKWQEIVPTGRDAIEGFSLIGGKLFVSYLHDVSSQIKIFTLDGNPVGELPLPGLGASSRLLGHWNGNEAFFGFRSYVQPETVYRYDVATGKTVLWAQPKVPFKSDDFEVQQVWYSSKDDTRIPMFLVGKKGLKPNGKLPVLLYGYGGFNVSLMPHFSSLAAVWVEQGGLYAVANLRGGGEFGEAWHKAGMLDKKQNVFDDFMAAAEWLIKNNYTNPSRLAVQGGSNGGLLVGSVLTQRPDLYRAVLCEFPDLDMIGYYRFKNNNPPALLEYGNASDPAQFKFLYAYSPYQKVKPGTKYPAVLLMTGDADTRVPPLQARKMTARLQAATSSGKPVLLLYDTKAGHAGGRPLGKIIDDVSLEIAFLFWQLKVNQPS
ncbi:MAG TPA: prolyl oligopeptidase family serine peptidase [Thermoanaerobaculia bacterium]|nr:prolyl oligopeptidase family serine peptidase [Thermoanaerobaculia bacterium]